MKKQIITREFLEKTGITKITEDGRIFKGKRELAQRKIVSKHKYGVDKVYLGVMLYDPECYQYQKAEHAKDPNKYKIPNGQKLFLVHRIIYAWFNGSTPADLDIAHKDDNSFNNSIDNLEAISHGENIAKRSIQANQYRNKVTELERKFDELKSQAEEIKNIKAEIDEIRFNLWLRKGE